MEKSSMLIIGHRGAHGLAPDNTAESFRLALDYGVDMIETDLVVTADGIVVLMHDQGFTDSSGHKREVADTTYLKLKEILPDVMTLSELLNLTNRRAKLMLEFKARDAVEPTVAILRERLNQGWQPSDFILVSFDFSSLVAAHRQMPEIDVAVLEQWSSVRATRRARALGTSYISMDQRFLWWGFIRMVSRRYKLFCYPKAKAFHIDHMKPSKWSRYGLYGNITDRPDLFRTKQRRPHESHAAPHRQPDRTHQDVLV